MHIAEYLIIFFDITQGNACRWIFLHYSWQLLQCLKGCFLFVPEGLKSEGLYRVSGFSDSVEEVKMAFDKGLCSTGSVCCNSFIDFCQLTTWRLTVCAHICLHKMLGTFQINEKLTHLWRISIHLGVQIWKCPLACMQTFTMWTGGTSGDTNHGYIFSALNISVKKTLLLCRDSIVDLVRMSLSWPSAVWILTVRKTLQQWAKLLARSACGRSSMTECHSSSQHCDVQSASTSRPWPVLESMHNWGKVRIKQARRMIRATMLNTEWEKIFSPAMVTQSLHSSIHTVMWKCWCEPFFSFSLSSFYLAHPHSWWKDRHFSECLWRHQYHHGCTETVPQGFACSCHLIRCLPQVHWGCK